MPTAAEIASELAKRLKAPKDDPARPYESFSDARLAQLTLAEADRIDELEEQFKNELVERSKHGLGDPDLPRWQFKNDFNSCCREVIRYLHGELLRRIPEAKSGEIEALLPSMLDDPQWGALEMLVERYSEWLRKTGNQLHEISKPQQ